MGAVLLLMAPLAHAGLGLNGVIVLPGVRGQFGRMTLDASHHRLFINVTGSDMLLALDLDTGTVHGRITGLSHPQDVVYLLQNQRLAVSNGASGDLGFYDADTLTPNSTITFGNDADRLFYDAATGRLYLGYGEGHESGIAITNDNGRPLVQLPLDSHPAGLALDAKVKRLYVNLPASHEIAVFDLKSDKRIATWSLGVESGANFPMALDADHNRLFVVTRSPDRLLVLEARAGRLLQTLVAPGDVDSCVLQHCHRRTVCFGWRGQDRGICQDCIGAVIG